MLVNLCDSKPINTFHFLLNLKKYQTNYFPSLSYGLNLINFVIYKENLFVFLLENFIEF